MTRGWIFALTVFIAACSDLGPGSKCGGAQIASARAFYPDTGVTAGTEILVVLAQHDPFLIGEESELVVGTRGPSPAPYPRVRLVRDDGRVLFDTLAWGASSSSSWIVYHIFKSAELRNAIFHAIETESLWIELWLGTAAQAALRQRLQTEYAEVQPISRCL